MSAIVYSAHERAPLITDSPAHVAGTQYSIDVKLQQYSQQIDTPKSSHVSIGGNVETVLRRATNTLSAVLIWPNSDDDSVQEFLFSIAGGESFSFDAYGTVATPDNAQTVVCMNNGFTINRMTHGEVHWRSVSLTLRPGI